MDLSELRASEARQKADKVALAAAARINDLEQEETPESLMLLTMTEEGARERNDREVVVPWLKFLWEIYRAVLELLHKTSKLDKVYHKTCEKAFKFCQDYNRTLEFRRLCEMLRTHLSNVQKMTGQTNRQNKVAWEWSPESIEAYLQTRFLQLEVSTHLELWNEGFKTVEEIYSIMQLGKKTPKPRLMSIYYEKLTRIFLVSENYLFHAYAWYRYHSLCVECRKDMKAEERTAQANTVLLATLSIPEDGVGGSATQAIGNSVAIAGDEDETHVDKNQQMAVLLDFTANPTRQALLSEIVANGILNDVSPDMRSLYDNLECSFRPLSLVRDVAPALATISSIPNLSGYVAALKRVTVVRAIQQLSKVYSVVKLDFVQKLIGGLGMPFADVEKLLVAAVQRKQVLLRIDHKTGCMRFDSSLSPASVVDSHLSQLGSSLHKFLKATQASADQARPDAAIAESESAVNDRRNFLDLVTRQLRDGESFYASRLSSMERKMLIERRKEERERLQQDRLRDEDARRRAEELKRIQEEERRLQLEEETRKQLKLAKLQTQMNITKTKNAMLALGKTMDDSVLAEMSDADLQKMLLDAQLEAQRAKEDESKRLADQAKRLDYITRAIRIESSQLVRDRYDQTVAEDLASYEQRVAKAREDHLELYRIGKQEKQRLFMRMKDHVKTFEDSLLGNQRVQYEKQAAALRKKAIKELTERRIANARFRKREDDDAREMEEEARREKAEKEEADRLLKEEHEQLRRAREKQLEEELVRERLQEEARKAKPATDAAAPRESDAGAGRAEEGPKPSADKWRPSAQRQGPPPAADRPVWGAAPTRGGDREREPFGGGGGSRDRGDDRGFGRGGAGGDEGESTWRKVSRPADRPAAEEAPRWGNRSSDGPSGGFRRNDDKPR
jgi:translation initiation factor 3 subunit A